MKYVELPSTLSFVPSVTATHAVDDDGSFVSTRTANVAAYDSRRFCLVRDDINQSDDTVGASVTSFDSHTKF